MLAPEDHVLIVGAGTFGLSTAIELLRKGHKNVTLLDPYAMPSPLSAGNDVNKVMQSTVEDPFYSDLALEALKKWRADPLYKPAFHESGIIYGGVSDIAVEEIRRRKEALKSSGNDIQDLNTPQDFAKLISIGGDDDQDSGNRFKNWVGYYQKDKCGWTFAKLALENVFQECVRLGAKFICDSCEELLFDNSGKCTGIRTYSGSLICSKRTVICAGANSIKLLDFRGQLLAKCWTVGHIKLLENEVEALKGTPVILNIDEGFLFEADCNGELKFCNEFPGYINMENNSKAGELVSVPIFKNQIPAEAADQMRRFLMQVFPSLSTRPFSLSKICWCTDTPDRHFLFDEHPDHKGLILGTGDSGKGFKYMPVVGEYISEIVLNGTSALEEDKRNSWRWRPEDAIGRDIYRLQQRMGGTNKIKDLKDIKEWTDAK